MDTLVSSVNYKVLFGIAAIAIAFSFLIVIQTESEDSDAWRVTIDNFELVYPNDQPFGPAEVLRYHGPGGVVKVPSKLGQHAVSVVQVKTFYDREDITEIIFEEGVGKISVDAIYMCPNITKITIPKSAKISASITNFPAFIFHDENQHRLDYDELGGYSYVLQNVHGARNCLVRVLNTYSVSFDVVGGSTSVSPIEAKEKSTFTIPSYSGEKDGSVFEGWSYGGKTYSPGDTFTMPSHDVKFKANWGIDFLSPNILAIIAALVAVLIVAAILLVKKYL